MITLRYSLDGGGTFGPWVEVDLPYTIAESKPWHSVVVETVGGEASLLPIATDGIPDPFGFDDVADQAPGEIVESAVVTPTGFNRPAVVTVTGGEYQILEPGGAVALAWRSVAGEILPGQGAQVRGLAPAGFSATSTVSPTIGGVSADWEIGTAAADTTPDAFGFTAATGAGLSAVVASNVITPTGFNSPASIAVIDGEYRIDGGAWTAAAGTISPGSTVQVRGTSSGSHVTATTVSLVIGGVTGTFSITTAADTAPDAFSFTDVIGAARGVYVSSSIIMPVGYAAAAPVTITGGEFSIEAQGFDSEPATISPGEVIQIRALTGSGFLEQSEVTLTIGGVSTTWSVTTVAEDTTPNAFTFTDVTDQPLDTFVWSDSITVSGINAPAAISVSGGQYRINGGAGTSSPGTVANGATVSAGVQTSASNSTAANVIVTIGGVSDTFTATTEAAPAAPWVITAGTDSITIASAPDVTAPTVVGGFEQITITG